MGHLFSEVWLRVPEVEVHLLIANINMWERTMTIYVRNSYCFRLRIVQPSNLTFVPVCWDASKMMRTIPANDAQIEVVCVAVPLRRRHAIGKLRTLISLGENMARSE
ncbi:hypothetical protein AVEN_134538-1 [Araneus ventricosus]|uniref:Uncharacterized protein n=1 Tax=Araneus ventricosus TaxID=182803 RepID=A0A4Y2VYB3_ARAVE|nr:hypothetical protein AVEN_134538-1 [Araneus ventricosus]